MMISHSEIRITEMIPPLYWEITSIFKILRGKIMFISGIAIGLINGFIVAYLFSSKKSVGIRELEKQQKKLEDIDNKLDALIANQSNFVQNFDENEGVPPDYF